MRKFLLSLSARMQLISILGMTVVMAFFIAAFINRIFEIPILIKNIDVITAVYQVLGTLYAVLLAFAVSGVWQNFSKAILSVQTEANTISDLVHMIEYSALEKSQNIRHAVLSYLKLVVEQEWQLLGRMGSGLAIPQEISRSASTSIIHHVLSMKPVSNVDIVIYGQILSLLNNWLDARRTRILIAKGNSAKALWPLLIFGAFVLFGFHGLFVIKEPEMWTLLLSMLSLIVGLCFYLVFSLDSPFTGKPYVDSAPFKWAINLLENESMASEKNILTNDINRDHEEVL